MFTMIDGGGPILKHAKVVLMYWGSGWGQNPAIPSEEITGVFNAILATPYMARLLQYGGICNARIIATDRDTSKKFTKIFSSTPAFSGDELIDFIKQRIDSRTVPDPNDDQETLYMVMSELGVVDLDPEISPKGVGGFHSAFVHNGTIVRYAWLSNPGNYTAGNNISAFFVHELVEACSDPDGGSGFRRNVDAEGKPGGENEIGDMCIFDKHTLVNITTPSEPGGVVVQSYWSNRDQACVSPTSYFVKWALADKAGSDHILRLRHLLPPGTQSVKSLLAC